MRERVENINIENAKLMFKNFSGKNDRFNPGRRNFSVIIEDEETALALKDEGWNIKTYQHDPEEPVIYRLEVRIKWDPFRPTIWMITESGGKTLLNEDTIDTLDDAEIKNVDIVIRPEDIKMVDAETGMLKGKVESVVFKGVHYEMVVDGVDHKWMIHSTKAEPVGSMIGMTFDPFDIHIMKKTSEEDAK